jgi:hypothetical protein
MQNTEENRKGKRLVHPKVLQKTRSVDLKLSLRSICIIFENNAVDVVLL